MTKAECLRMESRKCRKLADGITDPSAHAALLKLAIEYDAEALQYDEHHGI